MTKDGATPDQRDWLHGMYALGYGEGVRRRMLERGEDQEVADEARWYWLERIFCDPELRKELDQVAEQVAQELTAPEE